MNALACSCSGSYLAVWVRAATDRDLHILCGRHLQLLGDGKSVTDHGISMVLEKDCALLRVLDGPICIEEVEEEIVVHRPPRNLEALAALPFP